MKKIKFLFFANVLAFNFYAQETTITFFDEVVFYDGYAPAVSEVVPEGLTRHRNDLYSKKISDAEINSMGNNLELNVVIGALCDNYDRIGYVNLAFVPKGQTSYVPESVQRIEIARYITPFMNKNIQPDEVPYTWNIDNVVKILKDPYTRATYDFHIELSVFGVPYAANTEVSGCGGRNDVFRGTLKLTTTTEEVLSNDSFTILNFQNNLNDYQAGASDAIGQTTRTIAFNVPTSLIDAKMYLITSNHGANSGGEEYNRRFHYVSFDGANVLTYKPGETSCEPYRQYNTQGNGIYGASPRTDSQWQSFSNWCPGAIIPIRTADLGELIAGNHFVKIEVPTAVFANNEGNFPVSLYIQGTRNNVGIEEQSTYSFSTFPNPSNDKLTILAENIASKEIKILDFFGKEIANTQTVLNSGQIEVNTANLSNGIYFISILEGNLNNVQKVVISH